MLFGQFLLFAVLLFPYSYYPAQSRMCPPKGQGRKTLQSWFC